MTTRLPLSGLRAVSSVRFHLRPPYQHAIWSALAPSRHYATLPPSKQQNEPSDLVRPEKAALVEVNGLRKIDPVNPPRSTLPPPLQLPDRDGKNVAYYYFRVGRAYGSFYWAGVKAVWFNYQASKLLKERVQKQAQAESTRSISSAAWLDHLKRSEFQLLARNNHDIGKLPFFGLLVAVFGEWLPLLVPFIPSAVPGTCRIPKQTQGMRAKAEERRRISFRQGISEPSPEQLSSEKSNNPAKTAWSMTQNEVVAVVLKRFRDDQLLHLSCTLNNHNRMWDRVQLPPPSMLLRRGLSKRLAYLTSDDKLLNRDGGMRGLSSDELIIACEERGMDVLGKKEETLRKDLDWWLARQREDEGKGIALFTMLFRRPNAWKTVVRR